jgi:hypothetical protein
MPQNAYKAPGTRDSELDMRRLGGAFYASRLRRLLTTLLSYHAGVPMGTPRRSIDREQQEYSPTSD